jgi:ketosteroid isomerase-like protein
MNPVETVLAVFDAINRHDVDGLTGLMTDDHVFIDALGNSIRSREKMSAGWRGYFAMCPDYRVSHADIFHHADTVAAHGSAGGTISVDGQLSAENKWRTPAAWRVAVHNGLVQEFRVYADNKPVYEILARSAKPAAK